MRFARMLPLRGGERVHSRLHAPERRGELGDARARRGKLEQRVENVVHAEGFGVRIVLGETREARAVHVVGRFAREQRV
jgi:hypothetical protein